MNLSDDQIGKFGTAIYLLAGLPVAWFYIRQQKTVQPVKQSQPAFGPNIVVCTLAMMWPILLFCMALTYLQRKKPVAERPSNPAPDDSPLPN